MKKYKNIQKIIISALMTVLFLTNVLEIRNISNGGPVLPPPVTEGIIVEK